MVSYFDLILLVPFGLALWRGWRNGFVMEVISALSLFVGLYAGIYLSDWMTGTLKSQLDVKSDNLPIISFIVVFVLVILGLYFLGKLITKSLKAAGGEVWNKLGGAAFSLAKTILFLSVLFVFFYAADNKFKILPDDQREKSFFYKPVYKFSFTVLPALKNSSFYKQLQHENLTPENKSPILPFLEKEK